MNRIYYSIRNTRFHSQINRFVANKSKQGFQNRKRTFSTNSYSIPPKSPEPRYPWEFMIIPAIVVGFNKIYFDKEDCWK